MKRTQIRSLLWTLAYFALYLLWFFALEARDPTKCYVIRLPIDSMIPFCEYFIIPYGLWYFFLGGSLLYVLFTRPVEEYLRFGAVLMGGLTVCMVICTVFYTGLDLRPAIDPDQNIFCWLVNRLWMTDTSTNVLPSMHVYATLAACSGLKRSGLGKRRPILFLGCCVLGGLIILATMLLKQHSVVDVVCAFAVFAGVELAVNALWPALRR